MWLALKTLVFVIGALAGAAYATAFRTYLLGRQTWGAVRFGWVVGMMALVAFALSEPLGEILLMLAGGSIAGALAGASWLLIRELWNEIGSRRR